MTRTKGTRRHHSRQTDRRPNADTTSTTTDTDNTTDTAEATGAARIQYAPPAETETTIRWDALDHIAHIWTNDRRTVKELDKLAETYPETYQIERETKTGIFYTCPCTMLRLKKPPTQKQIEARKRNGERMANNLQKRA